VNVVLVGQFWVVAGMLALTPGADWAYAIGAGLRARSVVPSVLGMVCGYAVVVAVVAIGVGTLVTKYPAALTTLTIAGSGYLVYLGLTTFLRRAPGVTDGSGSVADSAMAQFARGAGVSGINPKGLLLLLALLPQFTSPTGWPAQIQMGVLGGLHILDCAIVYSIVGVLSSRILRTRPRVSVFVTKLSGVLMTLIGLSILLEQLVQQL